ncbi:M20/M25/M40 family metallo-hydrolase [Pseudoxanthomonas sp. PXM01]|uniref:M28 family metallopeptidase n=1 Tax=Pseudoxanthomonas sp. PXM01 TaxID=2769295 RepID=UPI00177BC9F3|nr:M20/M25/M40 family metallo-hydrolase [Pseudoxanthomonas sp. PXM01]MBD9467637.1 Zn-dependent exopeptidase M28 [Pseudoxanthomonas sp. PXM01]
MHHRRRSLRCALLFSLLASAPAWAADVSSRWHQQVEAISAGKGTVARGDAIGARLDTLGIAWKREAFVRGDQAGENLVADLGGPDNAPLLLIGAHYDKVAVGHGATDNASGVAAVLELAQALKTKPLQHHRVQVVFWDLEEKGLLGAHAWVETAGREQPALYVNFDVFGWGDTLWMMAPDGGTPFVAALREASTKEKLGFSPGDKYPPTDHLAFLKAGWPAVSFSLVGGDEIDPILAVFGGGKPAQVPKVMQVIHSERDTTAELDASRVDDALRVVEQGLRTWDHQNAH